MRRKMMLRFIAYYLILSLCISVVSGGLYMFQNGYEFGSAPGSGIAGALAWGTSVLGEFLRRFGIRASSAILPSLDFPSIFITFVSLCLLAAASFLFSHGVDFGYRRVKQRVDGLAGKTPDKQTVAKGMFFELEDQLNGLAGKLERDAKSVRKAETKRQIVCDEASMYLAVAEGRLAVMEEAGILREGSTELAMVRDALENLRKAEARISSLTEMVETEPPCGASPPAC